MNVSLGCLYVHSIVQKLFKTPIIYKKISNKTIQFHVNKEWEIKPCLLPVFSQKSFWFASKHFFMFCINFGLFRIPWLLVHWENVEHIKQIVYYSLLVCMSVIGIAAYHAIDQNMTEICFLINQRLKAAPISHNIIESANIFNQSVVNVIIYCFSSSFACFPAMCIAVSFLKKYDPVQIILNYIAVNVLDDTYVHFGNLVSKLLSLLFVGTVVTHGSAIVLTALLYCVLVLEGAILLTKNMLATSKDPNSFSRCVSYLNVLRLLIKVGYPIMNHQFIPVFVSTGLLVTGLCGLVVLVMHSYIPAVIFIACAFGFLIGHVDNIILTSLASQPHVNVCKFRQIWKQRLIKKVEQKCFKSLPNIWFAIRFVNVNFHTALTIADSNINLTSSLALLVINK